MTGSVLGGVRAEDGPVTFAPYIWSDLPGFVQSTAPEKWWFDVEFCQRALTDAGGVCQADALLVPLLHEQVLAAVGARTEDPADVAADITTLDEVQLSLTLVEQMVTIGRYGMISVLPTLGALGAALHGCEPEDLEDAMSDLARAALDTGAEAIAVRGASIDEVERTVARLSTVARYFGIEVLGVTPGRGWSSRGTTVHVLAAGESWPSHALATTYDDLTTTCSAADVRHWLTRRSEP
jgi:hypothetical protein